MNKRITLTLVLIMNLAWVLAQTSGTFGALTWSYADKQLTISGQGETVSYTTHGGNTVTKSRR